MGNWSIELCEKNLNIPGDKLLYGSHTSHSFLRLKDDAGNIVGELQGGSFDPEKKTFGEMNIKLKAVFNQVAQGTGNFLKSTLGMETKVAAKVHLDNELKVKSSYGAGLTPAKYDVAMEMMTGSKEEIMKRWAIGLQTAEAINKASLPYRPIEISDVAQNCNTASMAIAEKMIGDGSKMSPDKLPDKTFAMPGGYTRIKDSITHQSQEALSQTETAENVILALHSRVNKTIGDTPKRIPDIAPAIQVANAGARPGVRLDYPNGSPEG